MEKLPFFVGKWVGKGRVIEKGIDYHEVLTFRLLKQEPAIVIATQSFTWTFDEAGQKKPLHSEGGYIKLLPPLGAEPLKVEASYSHPFSLNEFEYGTYSSNSLDLELSEEHI